MKTLRCMAYQQNGVFVAACLDLSLAAQADTMQEAMDKLDSQIHEYIEEALSDEKYTAQLMSRKAPLSMWLKYWILAFRIFFGKRQGQSTLFREPCEASA